MRTFGGAGGKLARGHENEEDHEGKKALMADSDVLEKARRAREQAAALASGLKGAVADKVGDAKDLLTAGAADLRDAGLAKVRETLEDFNATLPALREAGYSLTEVAVTIGLSPTIVASFHATDAVSDERAAKVIEENSERKLTVFLVKTLLQAWKLQTSVHIAGMTPRAIAVEIGLTPSVVVKFA
jgi:hypothetical protein